MKRKIQAFLIIIVLLSFAQLFAQDQTSRYTIIIRNAKGTPRSGLNVDLYQGAVKIYDLSESSTNPGEYYKDDVVNGEYQLYVGDVIYRSGIWIGTNKQTLIAEQFDMSSSTHEVLTIDVVRADSLYGIFTGTVASTTSLAGDITIQADNDNNGAGDVILKNNSQEGIVLKNNGNGVTPTVIVGNANGGELAGSDRGIQVHSDTTVGLKVSRIYGGAGSGIRRSSYFWFNDDLNTTEIRSTTTGAVPGTDAFPISFFISGSGEVGRFYTNGDFTVSLGNVGIGTVPVSRLNVAQGDNYTAAYGLVVQSDESGYDLTDGMIGHFSSGNNFILKNQEAGYLGLFGNSGDGIFVAGDGGVLIGAATGGTQGGGTINVSSGIYLDGWPVNGFMQLPGAAWFGATADTIALLIPSVAFRHDAGDTAYIEINLSPYAVSIDSCWGEFATTLTSGDSARIVLGSRHVNFGEAYTGGFTTQNSNYVDLGGTANLATKFRFTTAIALTASRVLMLKMYRDNSIANNAAGRVKLARLWVFGRGLR